MAIPSYIIRGGIPGRERMRLLSKVMSPTTEALFDRVGVAPDATCLDVGCGGGDVSLALARRVPNGAVVAVDLDATKIDIAREEAAEQRLANVELRVADVTGEPRDADVDRYDLVYVRFLLTHLTDPAAALERLFVQVAPGGTIVAEDIDFTGHFCHPDSPAMWRYVAWYTRAAQSRGVDPNIGPRLPELLRVAGFDGIGMHVVQPAGLEGDVKLVTPITLEAIADALLAADLCSVEDLERTVDELYAVARDDTTVLSLPRIVQSWGRRPAA